jgi:hypothetical protein
MSTPFSGSKAAAAARHKDSELLAGKGVDLQIPDLIAPLTSLQPGRIEVSPGADRSAPVLSGHYVDQFLNRRRRSLQRGTFIGRKVNLDYLFSATSPKLDRHAYK